MVVVDGVDKLREGSQVELISRSVDAKGAAPAVAASATPDKAAGKRKHDGKRPSQNQVSRRAHVNPSKPVILRPVATSLLMVAILLAGAFAYRMLPISALPQGRSSHHPGRHPLSRR